MALKGDGEELLTLFEKMLHLLTCLVVINNDFKAQAPEALKQLTCVPVRPIANIHPF